MNYARLALATLGAFAAYFVFGGLTFGLLPLLRDEFARYPAIYRRQEDMPGVMPYGVAGMLLSILVLALLYTKLPEAGSNAARGARFGALIGLFTVGAFVIHNYVNLNIGLTLTRLQAVADLAVWIVVGTVIGVIYKPAARQAAL